MSRRLVGVVVAGECVGALVRNGEHSITVTNGLPCNARFYTAYFDNERNAFVCIFEDDSFSEVPEACQIPVRGYSHELNTTEAGDGEPTNE